MIEDRYSGTYSGGEWIAIACFYEAVGDGMRTRLGLVMDGAGGDDLKAAGFVLPEWAAVGDTPDEAVRNLRAKASR